MRERILMACGVVLVGLAGASGGLAAQAVEIRPGHPDVDGRLLPGGVDSTRVVIVRDGVEQEGPLQIEELWRDTRDGEPVLVQVLRIVGRVRLDDTTVYRLPGLAPVGHRSHMAGGRTLALRYGDASVEGELIVPDSGTTSIERTFEGPVFDPGVANLLLRVLPLRDGYEARVHMFNHGELRAVETVYRVAGDTTVTARGEDVPAWRVEIELWDGRVVEHVVARADRRVLATETRVGDMRMLVRPVGG